MLAPAPAVANGTWNSPIEIDPFDVAIEDKVGAAARRQQAALAVKGARFVNSSMFFLREEKTFASTDGSFTVQTIYRTAAVDDRHGHRRTATSQTRESVDVAPRGLGYEHVRDAQLVENAPKWADEAVQKLTAKSVDVGRYDLVLHPSHLWLTIHESVAHPTELDRAMGYEANYAGTSFVAPPEKVLGTLKYGSELMNIRGDRTQAGSLSACGWDDEGVKPEDFDIIKKGVFVDYHTTREQAPWLDWYYKKLGKPTRSHGCSYAQTWAAVQFQRMPNVSLLPGDKDLGWDDLIAATDRGIAIIGDGSFSIDQQRYNAQFGGQVFYEIKGGKIVGMLKDVAYQMKTPEFWASLDMIGGAKSYHLGGAFGDAKGQPVQVNAVSHGAPGHALPQRQRHQHRTHGMTSLRSLAVTARYLSREECEAIAKRALSFATADETRVLVNSTSIANTRFAVNQISTGGDSFDSVVTVISKFGKRSGSSSTNRLDDDGLRAGRADGRARRQAQPRRSGVDARARPADVSAGRELERHDGVAGSGDARRRGASASPIRPRPPGSSPPDSWKRSPARSRSPTTKACSPTTARRRRCSPPPCARRTERDPGGAARRITTGRRIDPAALGARATRKGTRRRCIRWPSSRDATPSCSSPRPSAISCSSSRARSTRAAPTRAARSSRCRAERTRSDRRSSTSA